MKAKERLLAQVPAGYQRPVCPTCEQTMQWVHFARQGSQYVCVRCELGWGDWDISPDSPISASEASWIIRHGMSVPLAEGDEA